MSPAKPCVAHPDELTQTVAREKLHDHAIDKTSLLDKTCCYNVSIATRLSDMNDQLIDGLSLAESVLTPHGHPPAASAIICKN